jgi:hypothetical protein
VRADAMQRAFHLLTRFSRGPTRRKGAPALRLRPARQRLQG